VPIILLNNIGRGGLITYVSTINYSTTINTNAVKNPANNFTVSTSKSFSNGEVILNCFDTYDLKKFCTFGNIVVGIKNVISIDNAIAKNAFVSSYFFVMIIPCINIPLIAIIQTKF